MWSSVKVTTKSTTLPISVEAMKGRLRIEIAADDPALAVVDAQLTELIWAAVAEIDGPDGIGVAIMAQSWTLARDGFSLEMRLPGAPVVGVSAIRYLDAAEEWQIVPDTVYRVVTMVEPARVVLRAGQCWPTAIVGPGVVEIEYTLGATEIAEADHGLVTAVALIAAHYYENREAVVVGTIATALPMGAQTILNKRRRGWVAG